MYTLLALVGVASAQLTNIISPSTAVLASKNDNTDFWCAYTCSQCLRGGHYYFPKNTNPQSKER